MRKPLSSLAPTLATICLLLAAGCEKENKTIKIATQSPLSGAMSVIGSDIKNGTQLAIEQLSGPLTKMGFKVELAPFDDQGNPDTGVANAKAIVSDPAVLGVVGHYNSGVQIPSSEEYHAANLCNVSPANTNPKVTDRGYAEVNRICGRDDVQGAVGAQFAKSKGIKTVYVLHDKTAYGQGIAEYFQKEAETQGIKVVGFAGTEEKANFDAILSPSSPPSPSASTSAACSTRPPCSSSRPGRRASRACACPTTASIPPTPPRSAATPCSRAPAPTSPPWPARPPPIPTPPSSSPTSRPSSATTRSPSRPSPMTAPAILLKAIENAAKANGGKLPGRADVCKAVRALQNFHGITATITFNPKGDPAKGKYFIIQVSSADPAKWAANRIDQTLDIAPPQ